jgi:hypothetical protein
MSRSSYKEQLMRLMLRASLERTHAEVVMTLMSMFNLVLVLISVEKNQPLLRASKASPVDPD